MASNGQRIAKLAREHVSANLPAYDRRAAGIDEAGLIDDTVGWLQREHAAVLAADTRSLLLDTITRIVKDAVQSTRPSAATILARAQSAQAPLPTLDEVSREVYRDGSGLAIALLEMQKRAIFEALAAYGKLQDEVGVKRARLAAIYAEMDRRGLSDTDTVRRLYEQAS